VAELATVADVLARARLIGVDRLDAQLLLAHHLGRPRVWVLAHDDALVENRDAVLALLDRRAAGEPLAYLTGEREFHGLMLRVTPDVLVPRPDTETLVDWALELLAGQSNPRVLDLGTGSGAIALAIKHGCPAARVHGSDASLAALEVARSNGDRLGLDVSWRLGDWWRPFEKTQQFDLAVANPPYLSPDDPHLADLRHEPRSALVALRDGLADVECIVAGAVSQLVPGGWLMLEHGFSQAEMVCEHLHRSGFMLVSTRHDLANRPRVTAGQLQPTNA
jgi:release factor glutamine methyltransferase